MASIRLTAPIVIAACAVFPPICTAVVALRFYARKLQRVGYGVDDWLTAVALVFLIGLSGAILRGVALQSVAYPTPPMAPQDVFTKSSFQQTITRQLFVACELLQVIALGCIKLSCMFFYRRIFRTGGSTSNVGRIIWYFCTILIGAWTVGFFFALLFPCGTHFEWMWGTLEDEARCGSSARLDMTFAISDVVTDVITVTFPIIPVWNLQMSSKKKIGITSVFLLAALAVMASVTRLVIYTQALLVEFDASSPPDEDLLSTAGIYFVYLEVGFGLIGCCLPALYGLAASKGLMTLIRSVTSGFSRSDRSKASLSAKTSKEFRSDSEEFAGSQTKSESNSTTRWNIEG